MTVIPINLRSHPGTCDVCGKQTGNLARHRPSCARKAGEPVSTRNLSEKERALVIRGGGHAMAEAALEPEARLKEGVTDLEVAILLAALEDGLRIHPSRTLTRWTAVGGSPLKVGTRYIRRGLSTVVNEALRLGLVHLVAERTGPAMVLTYLVPAIVHAHGDRPGEPLCGRPSTTIKRYRLVADLVYVDCQACVDRTAEAY
jgi:hypothetical protein